MTIAKTGNRAQNTGDGVTTAFPYPYRFFADTELQVYTLVSGVETLKALTTDYTVSNTGTEDGGTVTFLVAPAIGTTVTVVGNIPMTQVADYTENDAFPALTHETALDRSVRLIQRVSERLDRAIKVPASSTLVSVETAIPVANTALVWNASATALVNGPTANQIADANAEAIAAAASAAAAASSSSAAAASAAAAATFDPALYLAKANNLSDVANAATARTSLGLVIGTNVQAQGATLTSLSGLTLAAGDLLYATGADTLVKLAKGTSGQVLQMNSGATAPEWGTFGSSTVAAASVSSGTAVDFTVPSTANRIEILFMSVSLSGSDNVLVQLGDAGGVETTGYVATGNTTDSTSGFPIAVGLASRAVSGIMSLTRVGSTEEWVASHSAGLIGERSSGGGYKTLSAAITTIRVTRTGTDTFDGSGRVAIRYWG